MQQSPYIIAKSKLGLQEVQDRKELMKFFKDNGVDCDPVATPWCMAFVNACQKAGLRQSTGLLNARSALSIGEDIDEAEEGDIIIFERGNNEWQGHVGYFVKWDDDKNLVYVLGGNQQNQVNVSAYLQDHILGIRRNR